MFLLLLLKSELVAQLELRVVVNSAEATTSCTDFFFTANPHWSVLIDAKEWVTYQAGDNCYPTLPNEQYKQSYDCIPSYLDSIQVCFKVFDNDGAGCSIKETCTEEICEFFAIPNIGEVVPHELALPNGGDSEGKLSFTISLLGNPIRPENDFICDAVDFGELPFGARLGNADASNFSNHCGTNENDVNPFENAAWANDKGVWFKFKTGKNPGTAISIIGKSDPSNLGDFIDLQFALYTSSNDQCDGQLSFVAQRYDWTQLDETLVLNCPPPETVYYLLVDGPEDGTGGKVEGFFGLEILDNGIAQPQLLIDTILCYGAYLNVGDHTYTSPGTYTDVIPLNGSCDSVVTTQIRILDELLIDVQQVEPVSFEGLADGIAKVNSTGGLGAYTYLWSNGARTQINNNLVAGVYCVTVTDENGCQNEDCVTIETDLFPIDVTIKTDSLNCFGDSDASIYLSMIGGETPYQYTWQKQGTSMTGAGTITNENQIETISHLSAGKYILNLSDASSLSTSIFVEIIEPQEIVSIIDTMICEGESIVIGNQLYNEAGQILEILQSVNGCDSIVKGQLGLLEIARTEIDTVLCASDVFSFEGKDYFTTTDIVQQYTGSNTCDSIVSIHLRILEPLSLTIEQYQLATGFAQADAAVKTNVTGGSGLFEYLWTDGQTTATTQNMLGGENYCLTVTDQYGCTISDCIQLKYSAENIATVQTDTLRCSGEATGTINIIPNLGKAPFQYNWKNKDNTLSGNGTINSLNEMGTIRFLPEGEYQITISDANEQTTKSAIILAPPPLQIELTQQEEISCFQQCDGSLNIKASGGVGNYQYQWSKGLPSQAIQTQLCADNYEVTVSDALSCTATMNFVVTEPLVPLAAQIEVLAEPSCFGEKDASAKLIVTGDGGGTYDLQWSNGSTQQYVNELAAGWHFVTLTNNKNCTVIDSVFIQQPAPIEFTLSKSDPNCIDGLNSGMIQVANISGGVAPYLYSIDKENFLAFDQFQRLSAGDYELSVEDSNGCLATAKTSLSNPPEVKIFTTNNRQLNLGESIDLEASSNIANVEMQWIMEDTVLCMDCYDVRINPLHSTTIEIRAKDPTSGCTASEAVFVRLIKSRPVFIPNAFSPNDDGVNDYFQIFVGAAVRQIHQLSIYDRVGALVYQQQSFLPGTGLALWDGKMNGKLVNSGVYVYVVEVEFIDGEIDLLSGDVTLIR